MQIIPANKWLDADLKDDVFCLPNLVKGNVTMGKRGTRLVDVDLEDTIQRTFVHFVQTADAVLKYADTSFYKAGLSETKFVVLQVLAVNGGTMTPSEIAQWTLRERHNITTLVNRLEHAGLVRTERSSRDRRFLNVTLTDRGREVLSQVQPVAREIVNQVMSSISEDDAVLLEKLLGILRQNAHHGLECAAERSQQQPD